MTFLRNRRVRSAVYQGLYVGGLVSLIIVALVTAHHNLTSQGITSGFGFLWRSTGWEMGFSLLPTSANDPYWYFLAVGFLNTIVIGVVSLVLASLIGAVVGVARISDNLAAQFVSTLYVELFRNIPLIVQLFFWYSLFGRIPAPRQAVVQRLLDQIADPALRIGDAVCQRGERQPFTLMRDFRTP